MFVLPATAAQTIGGTRFVVACTQYCTPIVPTNWSVNVPLPLSVMPAM